MFSNIITHYQWHAEIEKYYQVTPKLYKDLYKSYNYQSLPMENLRRLDIIGEHNISFGLLEMKKHKAVFVGIARDNAIHLPGVMRHIEYIGQFFADYKVIIFENDSADATKLILGFWRQINLGKIEIISKNFFNKKRPSIKFMAEARNEYLQFLEKPEYDEFDIVIPVDMDMSHGIDIRGVQDSFSKIDRWDVVCSNGIYTARGRMYDIFAFRTDEFPETPKEHELKYKRSYLSWENKAIMQVIYSPDLDLIPVQSCFGGLAIYKREFFNDCYYDSIDGDCEHVYLHKCMREKHNAKIFMNPAQIIRYEHYR